MASTSPEALAAALLEQCLGDGRWNDAQLEALVRQASAPASQGGLSATRALFTGLVEPLADAFEPALCGAYGRLFSNVLERLDAGLKAETLAERYVRVRRPRRIDSAGRTVTRICFLSRVTLGADVAVTSVLMDAARRRFPEAELWFAGPRKNWELFAAVPGLRHVEVNYGRSATLPERLDCGRQLAGQLRNSGAVVIDPDSRLTQLGLLPVCGEEDYFFFESRAYGAGGEESLAALAARWAEQTFGVAGAQPFISVPPPDEPMAEGAVSVSLGIGENAEKSLGGAFEAGLLAALAARGASLLVDRGAGGEEAGRVQSAVEAAAIPPEQLQFWDGAFAPFAARIARSRLYVGYDSAGQHVAAACGTPLVVVFAGFARPRTFQRWQPTGPGPKRVIEAAGMDAGEAQERTVAAVDQLLANPSTAAQR